MTAATIWTYVLPPVKINKQSISENQKMNIIVTTTETKLEHSNESIKSSIEVNDKFSKYVLFLKDLELYYINAY